MKITPNNRKSKFLSFKFLSFKQEPWKVSLPIFIEKCYDKRFKKERPDVVISIEQLVKGMKRKKEERRAYKAQKQKGSSISEANAI